MMTHTWIEAILAVFLLTNIMLADSFTESGSLQLKVCSLGFSPCSWLISTD